MKKLMKKKVNLFGKQFSVFVLVLVGVMAFGSAALVPYLSGAISGNVSVDSPIVMTIDSDVDINTEWVELAGPQVPSVVDGDSISITDAIGGDKHDAWVKVVNNAEIPADANVAFNISNTEGLDDAEVLEIVSLDVYDWEAGVARLQEDVDFSSAIDCDSNLCQITIPTYLFESGATGDTYYVNVKFDFPLNAHGTYEMDAQVMNA